jgi:mitotic spindle assembly checkpoint protein MAD1
MRSTTLERQVFSLQATEREQAKQIEEQRLEIERLKSDRRLLAASERREKEAFEECEQQWNEEKVSSVSTSALAI